MLNFTLANISTYMVLYKQILIIGIVVQLAIFRYRISHGLWLDMIFIQTVFVSFPQAHITF